MTPSTLLPTGESMIRFRQTCRIRHYGTSIGLQRLAGLIRINLRAGRRLFVVSQQMRPVTRPYRHLMYIKEAGDSDCYAARAQAVIHSGHHSKNNQKRETSGAQKLFRPVFSSLPGLQGRRAGAATAPPFSGSTLKRGSR